MQTFTKYLNEKLDVDKEQLKNDLLEARIYLKVLRDQSGKPIKLNTREIKTLNRIIKNFDMFRKKL